MYIKARARIAKRSSEIIDEEKGRPQKISVQGVTWYPWNQRSRTGRD